MKQVDQSVKYLGHSDMYWAQWLVLSIWLLFAAGCVLIYFVYGNINNLYVALMAVIMCGGFSWLHTRLREVRMDEDKFVIRNIFGRDEIDYQDFEGMQEGVLPWIYEIKFKGERTYPFMLKLSYHGFDKRFFSLYPKDLSDDLTKQANDHFGLGSENAAKTSQIERDIE